THWLSEIISMLVNSCHRLTKDTMKHLEYLPLEVLDSMPSPVKYHSTSTESAPKSSSACANPRDVAVSYFKFISNLNLLNYSGNWNAFVPLFINGNLPYNSWFEHTDTWLKVARSGKHKIQVVFYEDLHRDFNSTVSRLADFLDVDYTPELIAAVHLETTFDNMKTHKDDFTLSLSKNGESPIYRKGEVGDWVNWFTHEQIEQIDQKMEAWRLHLDNRIKYFTDQPNPTYTSRVHTYPGSTLVQEIQSPHWSCRSKFKHWSRRSRVHIGPRDSGSTLVQEVQGLHWSGFLGSTLVQEIQEDTLDHQEHLLRIILHLDSHLIS
ncbi:sulfotransferase 1B1-like, partial [Physella acuta]|uniref:sulfotransferase 1B1-like n=1 Tax=Physella acuta TaxID=109671 RepID=UPI0027DD9702